MHVRVFVLSIRISNSFVIKYIAYIHPLVHKCIHPSNHPISHPCICAYVHPSIHPFTPPTIRPSTQLPTCIPHFLSTYLYICITSPVHFDLPVLSMQSIFSYCLHSPYIRPTLRPPHPSEHPSTHPHNETTPTVSSLLRKAYSRSACEEIAHFFDTQKLYSRR
jgi:hypothetical protein